MTRTLIVDGTRYVIADGRPTTLHVIANKTDYTHQRIVGYAMTLEDAALFAAAEDMREALRDAPLPSTMGTASEHFERFYDWLNNLARAALSKSETP